MQVNNLDQVEGLAARLSPSIIVAANSASCGGAHRAGSRHDARKWTLRFPSISDDRLSSAIRDFDVQMKIVPNTLGDSAAHLQNTADTLAANADQSATVVAGLEEASANVQAIAATEQLASSVGQIGRRISESSGITATAVASRADHAATRIFAAANEISGRSDLLRTNVEGFVAAIGTS